MHVMSEHVTTKDEEKEKEEEMSRGNAAQHVSET